MDANYEIRLQLRYAFSAIRWIIETAIRFAFGIVFAIILPVRLVFMFIRFYFERIAVLMCNSLTLEGRRRDRRAELRLEESEKKKKEQLSRNDHQHHDPEASKIVNGRQEMMENLIEYDESRVNVSDVKSIFEVAQDCLYNNTIGCLG